MQHRLLRRPSPVLPAIVHHLSLLAATDIPPSRAPPRQGNRIIVPCLKSLLFLDADRCKSSPGSRQVVERDVRGLRRDSVNEARDVLRVRVLHQTGGGHREARSGRHDASVVGPCERGKVVVVLQVGPGLAGGEGGPDIAGVSDSNPVINIILDGDGSMPGFADTLSNQDISDIIAWLGSL